MSAIVVKNLLYCCLSFIYRVGRKKPSAYMSANCVFQKYCTFKVNNAR